MGRKDAEEIRRRQSQQTEENHDALSDHLQRSYRAQTRLHQESPFCRWEAHVGVDDSGCFEANENESETADGSCSPVEGPVEFDVTLDELNAVPNALSPSSASLMGQKEGQVDANGEDAQVRPVQQSVEGLGRVRSL